jgi:uncharacterized protein YqgQ
VADMEAETTGQSAIQENLAFRKELDASLSKLKADLTSELTSKISSVSEEVNRLKKSVKNSEDNINIIIDDVNIIKKDIKREFQYVNKNLEEFTFESKMCNVKLQEIKDWCYIFRSFTIVTLLSLFVLFAILLYTGNYMSEVGLKMTNEYFDLKTIIKRQDNSIEMLGYEINTMLEENLIKQSTYLSNKLLDLDISIKNIQHPQLQNLPTSPGPMLIPPSDSGQGGTDSAVTSP